MSVFDLPAEIEIAGQRNGIEFAATVNLTADGAGMSFYAPESMKGLDISTSGGVWGSRIGDISMSGLPSEMIGAPIKVFREYGEVISAEKVEEGTLIKARSGDTVREYLIDSKSGLPLKIKEMSAQGALIMDIEIKNYTIKEE